MYISVNYRRMPITFYISGKHFVGLVIINKRAKLGKNWFFALGWLNFTSSVAYGTQKLMG